jgi:methylmalonyl-CoA mutase cobalamin-binding subunit
MVVVVEVDTGGLQTTAEQVVQVAAEKAVAALVLAQFMLR